MQRILPASRVRGVLNRFGGSSSNRAVERWANREQTANFRQTAPENSCQPPVCGVLVALPPKRLSTRVRGVSCYAMIKSYERYRTGWRNGKPVVPAHQDYQQASAANL